MKKKQFDLFGRLETKPDKVRLMSIKDFEKQYISAFTEFTDLRMISSVIITKKGYF